MNLSSGIREEMRQKIKLMMIMMPFKGFDVVLALFNHLMLKNLSQTQR